MPGIVGIKQCHPVPGGHRNSGISSCTDSLVFLPDYAYTGKLVFNCLDRMVGGSIVYDDDLVDRVPLVNHRLDCPDYQATSVECRNYGADLH